MKRQYMRGLIFFIMIFSLIIFSGPESLFAADTSAQKDMGGWGIQDPYNQFYSAEDVERMKVVVSEVKEVVPLEGMSPGVALVFKDEDGEDVVVHLCPVWYKKPGKIGIKKGDKIDLRGVYAEINGEEVIMAAKIKIKKKGKTFKVRLTSDGTPFWTMSPAQLQKELSDE